MLFTIDARLDQRPCSLTVYHSMSGRAVMRLQEPELKEMLEAGDICMQELTSSDSQTLHNLAWELLLFQSAAHTRHSSLSSFEA
ncbi:hypothetical protein FCL40_12325 [Ferrimonas sediminicola]|uniref:Uncharacterized protein n=1 Tax=Ferrimonas sediminicola TaxID=2569538 RepID=A0A4U1BES1_9GAMM|nr:hypothetical protein [Ferrimonas sediminicola]TKB48490.1 hypothetical protein FCL40_12325 [Ferrimonas sediminicola]